MGRCSEFEVDGAETENAREVKLLVIPEDLARRFVLEERKALDICTHTLIETGVLNALNLDALNGFPMTLTST